jgi:hypothetical protein
VADVFISYKRAERDRVRVIADLLKAENLDVWFDARLEVGRGEGFDAEIEREVTSAACVVVCWTPDATRSIYVKGESKKGLEREVLVPALLAPCVLPVPFNAVDTADLIGWSGDAQDAKWLSLLATIKHTVAKSKANEQQRIAHSHAAYERLTDKVYPGTLKLLVGRLAAVHDADARNYHADIEAVLTWLESVAEKELRLNEYGYELADRQSGGNAWYWWDNGGAAERSTRLSEIRQALKRIDGTIVKSQEILDKPAP